MQILDTGKQANAAQKIVPIDLLIQELPQITNYIKKKPSISVKHNKVIQFLYYIVVLF